MRRFFIFVSMLMSVLLSHTVRSAEIKAGPFGKSNKPGAHHLGQRPEIHVVEGDWEGAKTEEIEAVLSLVADKILMHFPAQALSPITVSPTHRNPVVLFQKSADNTYQVHLSAKGKRWAEYIYEFSHELFHILANYQHHAPPKTAPYLWLEESLCESASVYTLKQLSLTWEDTPPRAEWASYAQTLRQFTGRVLGEQQHYLPADVSLTKWFRENEPLLTSDPYLRDKNALVANLLLPLLEQNEDWGAVASLNATGFNDQTTFDHYLTDWHRRTPTEHQELTRRVMQMFQFQPSALAAYPVEKPREDGSLSESSSTSSPATPTKKPG